MVNGLLVASSARPVQSAPPAASSPDGTTSSLRTPDQSLPLTGHFMCGTRSLKVLGGVLSSPPFCVYTEAQGHPSNPWQLAGVGCPTNE